MREVRVTSRGTCGYRRVHAELTMAMGVSVSGRTVHKLMRLAGSYGLPGPTAAGSSAGRSKKCEDQGRTR
ncbi:transposase [Leifsonia xyli]|uniref:transposase n=1 Tax=Leifsonia xyli TaxID=1575 RepID=UPI00210D4140|nr:transposase [Leifsonia xyli]